MAPWLPATPGPQDASQERDSLGVVIVESEGTIARGQLQWQVDALPGVVIGDGSGGPESELYFVQGVAQLEDGRIVVVDGGSREVRAYDPTGGFLGRIGGEGPGPAEFRSPRLLDVRRDSLWIYDQGLRRFAVISSALDTIRTFNAIRAAVGGRVHLTYGDFVLATTSGQFNTRPFGVGIIPYEVRLVDLSSGRVNTILSAANDFVSLDLAGRGYVLLSPWAYSAAVAAEEDAFYVAQPNVLEIRQYRAGGTLQRIMRVIEEPFGVSDAVFDSVVALNAALQAEESGAEMGIIVDGYERIPRTTDVTQIVDGLLLDESGWLWARIHEPVEVGQSGARRWIVLDESGRAQGTMRTPEGLDVHEIGEDYILGVWRDELGVEMVRRYGLRRGLSRG